jgi:hypothetical protein
MVAVMSSVLIATARVKPCLEHLVKADEDTSRFQTDAALAWSIFLKLSVGVHFKVNFSDK